MCEAWEVLVEFGFKVHRGMEAEGAVAPHAVVKDFDPFKDGGPGFATRGEVPLVNEFAFQRAPEAFHGGVVVAVAPACGVACPQQRQQLGGGLRPLADATLRPRLIAAARHLQRGAQLVQGVLAKQRLHMLEALSLGLAKMPNVFLESPADAGRSAGRAATGGSPPAVPARSARCSAAVAGKAAASKL